MTDKETQALAGVASELNAELDVVEDGMMCVFVDDTEISRYLMMHINDPENMQGWQTHVCQVGAETINKLRAEVKRLRENLKQEADYLQFKDWHQLNLFEQQIVTKLENLGFLEKKEVADGFVGRSI